MVNKLFYNTVLCQCFSKCNKYLIAGNLYGDISIFDLDKILNPSDAITTDVQKPIYNFTVCADIPVWSMVMTNKFLVVGTVNEIYGWNFKSLITSRTSKPAWTIKISTNRNNIDVDVNSLWCDSLNEKIFAGCSDNTIHLYTLEDGSLVRKFEGHTDYIHCVHGSLSQIASASEDGTVKLWDMNQEKFTNELIPFEDNKLNRAKLGKWMGSVTLSKDWMLCGGGPKLSLWHLRSLEISAVFNLPDCGIHVTNFVDDHILAAGDSGHVFQMTYNGDLLSDISTSAFAVYSVVYRNTPSKILSIAGSSNNLDICTSLSYRDQVIAFK